MKNTLIKVTLAALAVVLLGSCEKINQRIDALEERIDGIETEKIASIDSQIASINSSIADLGTIRSNVSSLRSQVDDHSTDIFNLEEADRALKDRILNLEDYLDDVLPTYAEKDWVKATFSTLEQYEATCDTIAKIDARIGRLDERLSKDIKDCADSLKRWVNVQFEAYYTAAEMDAALEYMQAEIDSLKSGSSDYKLDSLANELRKTKAAVDSAKAQLTREYKAAIDTAITHLEGNFDRKLQQEIEKVNADITALTTRVTNLEISVATLTGRIVALESMIQTVTIVPSYSDGSVKVEDDTLYLDCIISPASAVSSLTKANFTVLVNKVLTKALDIKTISITEDAWFSKNPLNGTVSLKVPVENYIPESADSSLTVAVNVQNGISDYTTEFVPVANENYYVSIGKDFSGTYILPKTNGSVHIEIGGTTGEVTLQYAEGFKPKKIFLTVVGTDATVANLKGDLAASHVEFTSGKITNVELTTSASTFVVKKDATITNKLTVKGGNVVLKGATVNEIEVAATATADGDKAPVEIVMEKDGSASPSVTSGITAKANVVVAPAKDVTVKVTADTNVKVANGGEGKVQDKEDKEIKTMAAAKIGDIKYITLADAVAAVKNDEIIDVISNNISATVIPVGSKVFTIDLGGKEVTVGGPAVGSSETTNQAFQILKGNTVTIQNGTLKCENTSNIFRFVIQNYSDLTLKDVTVDGTNLKKEGRSDAYTVSANNGTVTFAGNTKVKASTVSGVDGYAIDLYDYTKNGYSAPAAGIWNSDGSVEGIINIGGGKFTVSKDLTLTKPIKAYKGDSDVASKLIVNADITPVIGWTSANNGGDALVVVRRGGNLEISGNHKISYNNQTGVYSATKVTEIGESETGAVAKLTVGGSVTLEGYYYGIVGNGSRHDTDITINGGTIKGINANDCVGIYHPQKGNLTINGGTIEGATGIYVKSGDVKASITAGTIKGVGTNCKTYDPNRQGDGCDPTGDALVVDNCQYPGGEPTVEISGGAFISEHYKAVASYAKTGYSPVTGFIKGGKFSDLSGVIHIADKATYTLGADVTDAVGISLDTKKTFTVDFDGHTYTVNKPGAGSTGTQTMAFQLLKDQNVIFKNGTIKAASDNLNAEAEGDKKPIKRFIQNYANLTLTDMTLDGTYINGDNSVVEFCNGNVLVNGSTNFTAKANVASINVDAWTDYPNGTAVTINTTGNVGKIYCYSEGSGTMTTNSSLTIQNGKNITIDDNSGGKVVITDQRNK